MANNRAFSAETKAKVKLALIVIGILSTIGLGGLMIMLGFFSEQRPEPLIFIMLGVTIVFIWATFISICMRFSLNTPKQ
jgi:uncharacterized membrane protein YphA (DoxX/SURF4 family)